MLVLARLRHRKRGDSRLLAQGHLRLSGHGRGFGGIAFVSMTVWAHHMFTVGMTSVSNAFFVLSTMMVGIPTGIKIFNWLATMWGGKIRFATPMLFCTAFVLSIPRCRTYRHHAFGGAVGLATA